MHIEFLCTSEVAAGKMTCYHFKSRQTLCTLVQNGCVNQRWATQLLIFFKINTPTIRLSLHCSKTMVGGHEKQSESNTTSTSSSASASASAVSADWLITPSLRKVRVDTQYVGINEEQKQQIRQLQEELTEFNCVWYRTLPAIASRVRNVLRSSKKVSMTPIDHINQQAVATYGREAIWPGNKSSQRVGVSGGMIKEVCVRWY